MRAAVTTGEKGKMVVKDFPMPEVKPGSVLLKVKYAGICGSDLEFVDGALEEFLGSDVALTPGATPGHDFSAEIAEIGEGVEGWSIGDRVTGGGAGTGPMPYPFYFEKQGPGNPWGAMEEYFVRPANSVQKLPDSISDEEGAMLELITIGLAGTGGAGLKIGDSVVIVGAGRIGLGTMTCAKAIGADPVIATDLVKSRLDTALEMGADVGLNAKEVDVVSEVRELTGGGADAVIICAREGKVLQQAVDIVRRGGIVVRIGWTAPEVVNPIRWGTKRVTVTAGQHSHYGPPTFGLNLLVKGRVKVKPAISAIMPLEDIQKGFDSMYSGENIAVLLKP